MQKLNDNEISKAGCVSCVTFFNFSMRKDKKPTTFNVLKAAFLLQFGTAFAGRVMEADVQMTDHVVRGLLFRRAPFQELVSRLAPTHVVLDSEGTKALRKVWAVGKSYMQSCVQASLRCAGSRPALMVYGSDMTPMLHKFRTQVTIAGKTEKRETRDPTDWLLHRSYYLQLDAFSRVQVKTLFEAPLQMLGKKTWFLYSAAERFRLLRDYKPAGINISFYVFDRGGGAALIRLLRRRHMHALQQIEDPIARCRASLHEWILSSFCADHDVQNALCHGSSRGVNDRQMVYKNIFKAVRSAKDTLSKLIVTLPDWLADRLEIDECVFDRGEVLKAWVAVGAKLHVAEALADINLRFEDGKLRCTPAVLEHLDPAGHIAKLVLACYRLSTFTTSRCTGSH